MARFDAIQRREELRDQHARVVAAHGEARERVAVIAQTEDPHSLRPGGAPPRPLATRNALQAARVGEARGEPGAAADVKRLAAREAELDREIAEAYDQMRLLARGKAAVEDDVRRLHVDHLDAFGEAAEERVAEVARLAEELAPMLDAYARAWEAATEAWREPAQDNGLPLVGRCPVPSGAAVRGMVPRPPGVRPADEAEAA